MTALATPTGAAFTERQLQVLQLLKDGATNVEIGKALFISPDTVKTHVRILFALTGTHNRVQLAIWVYQHDKPADQHHSVM